MHVLDALGNPVRRAILERLVDGPLPVGRLADGFDVSRPAISRHVKVLEAAHLVQRQRMGRNNYVLLDTTGIEEARRWLDRLAGSASEGHRRAS